MHHGATSPIPAAGFHAGESCGTAHVAAESAGASRALAGYRIKRKTLHRACLALGRTPCCGKPKETMAHTVKGAATDGDDDGNDAALHHTMESPARMVSSDLRQRRPLEEHRTRFLAEFLRAYSPSTDVIGSDVLIYGRRGITITDVIPVGNYALRIVFSDGHSGGIYPYEYLFHLGCEKYSRMREYIRRLRAKHKSRDPPKRAPSQRLSRIRSAQRAEGRHMYSHGQDDQ
ncbi:Myb domain protein 40 [Trypanosoma cruzi]|nr:Myb domain protein 40 [Trypanosoma cruzi]